MALEVPAVLQHLKSLSPNHIYFLAPKAFVLRGYEYYAQGRLEAYHWNKNRTILSASVRGSKYYAVTFSVQHGQLTHSCRCPAWTPSTQCKHVICALLTTVNVLAPDTFRVSTAQSKSSEHLAQQLLNGTAELSGAMPRSEAVPQFEVNLLERSGQASVVITNHGEPCRTFLGMPTALAVLLRATQDPAWSIQDAFQDFLKDHGQSFPIYFDNAEGRSLVEWAPSTTYTVKTEFDVRGDQVWVAARCFRFGAVQDRARLFMGLVVDLDAQKLAPLDNEQGWALYDVLAHAINGPESLGVSPSLDAFDLTQDKFAERTFDSHDENYETSYRPPLSIPVEEFASLQIDLPTKDLAPMLKAVRLRVDGQDVQLIRDCQTPQALTKRYRLSIMPEVRALDLPVVRPDTAALQAEVWHGPYLSGTSEQIFGMFPYLEYARVVSTNLRTKKRRMALYETFFQLCRAHKPTEIKKVIKACLRQEAFRPFRIKSEAEELLQLFVAPLLEPSVRLLVFDGQWYAVDNEWTKEAALYAIPYQVWGLQAFENFVGHDMMLLPQDVLYAGLPDCYAKAEEAGIELFFQDQAVSTAQWDFAVEAERPATIDWFELRPEIMCDGVRLQQQDIQAILSQGGLMEVSGQVRIVDQKTQDILRLMTTLAASPSSPKGRTTQSPVVRIPKLQILDWVALRKKGVQVRLPKEDDALVERLLNFKQIEPVPVPKKLKAKLRRYQQEGYRWLAFLYQHRLGACLADDMGLGKTIQAISLLAGIQEKILQPSRSIAGPHLVVLPPSLLFNWEQEIARFYPTLNLQKYSGKGRHTDFRSADVVLTTYGMVRRDIAVLENVVFHVILFDEAQAVKNIKAETTGAARRLKGYFKCVMTGTPLENHVGEYYSLMDLCVPGLLSDDEHINNKGKAPSSSALEVIMQRTKPFVLRRTKGEILKELPPKIETDIYLELTDRQKTLYQQTVASIRSTITTAYRTKTAAQARIIALTAILKLRQICLSPSLLQKGGADMSPKLHCVLDRLQELMEEGHSALVFSQFTSFLDLVEQEFQSHHLPYVRLDGGTPTPKRKKLVQEFQENARPSIFLLSLKAGGQGLNLTKASYVFHLDPWWNPAVENQASDRAHRIGQTQKVSIMRLLMRHTIEEKMMELKQQKTELYHAVLEGATHRGAGAGLTQQDFDFLLS